ncbi:lambda exonuclease family protein [Scrofimicrobium canadense]|nr:lambda exonuclease family protein [Scrofimicrobium canadense]
MADQLEEAIECGYSPIMEDENQGYVGRRSPKQRAPKMRRRSRNIKIYDDVVQGTDEWLELRLGIVTASVIGALLTPGGKASHGETARKQLLQLAAERITGRGPEPLTGRAIMRGHLDEPLARQYYADNYAPVREVGFIKMVEPDFTLGYSPDGLVGDDGLIEIKSRDPRIQVSTVLADEPPKENMAQLQTGLYVTGRDYIDYVSFAAGMPLYVKRVLPDPDWFEAIEAAAFYAEKAITQMVDTFNERMKNAPATEYVNHFEDIDMEGF